MSTLDTSPLQRLPEPAVNILLEVSRLGSLYGVCNCRLSKPEGPGLAGTSQGPQAGLGVRGDAVGRSALSMGLILAPHSRPCFGSMPLIAFQPAGTPVCPGPPASTLPIPGTTSCCRLHPKSVCTSVLLSNVSWPRVWLQCTWGDISLWIHFKAVGTEFQPFFFFSIVLLPVCKLRWSQWNLDTKPVYSGNIRVTFCVLVDAFWNASFWNTNYGRYCL